MPEKSKDVDSYLAALPDERQEALGVVRDTILAHLPDGMEEAVAWGMISYQVPLERSGPTYNGKPLMYAALANQKHHMAVYLTNVYSDPGELAKFRDRYVATGKPLDMGKSCVRFRSIDDLPLDVIGDTIGATTLDEFVTMSAR